MKLYKVIVEYEVLVSIDEGISDRDTKFDCEDAAISAIRSHEEPSELFIREVKSEKDIPFGWRNSIPYGKANDDSNKTCEQILEEQPKPPYNDPNQMPLPGFDSKGNQ